ncbi:hypothetical protein [Bradyrhizobium sp. dw_78]|uniref:hypothetical protein n=1 Tax=Bradyrhizobium sp. dw_78 TaxID=2719793 RepID=UPI001BD2A9CF|nr:hypothetical protein [Bradyrhizobium sp. dw_78]
MAFISNYTIAGLLSANCLRIFGTFSTTFTYDPNGNQISRLGRNIAYAFYNKLVSITQGGRTISFLDDTEHQRFKQVTPEGPR